VDEIPNTTVCRFLPGWAEFLSEVMVPDISLLIGTLKSIIRWHNDGGLWFSAEDALQFQLILGLRSHVARLRGKSGSSQFFLNNF
jgi:hypothetical protein